MKDPWKILHILPTRDLGKIKAAYRARAQKFHPDKVRTLEEKRRNTLHFTEVQEAYARAKFMAQYAANLQPLYIRLPPDPSESVLLSNDWFMAAVVIVAGLFGFWLIHVSAAHAVHVPSSEGHALLVARAAFILAWIRIPAFGGGRAGGGALRGGLQRFAWVTSWLQACARGRLGKRVALRHGGRGLSALGVPVTLHLALPSDPYTVAAASVPPRRYVVNPVRPGREQR